jgi:REP element-mobilizing transposase RayT
MSSNYKFKDNTKLYFVTFTLTNWIDLFIRNEYKDILLESIKYCQKEKDLELYSWCIMTSHAHFIIGTKGNELSNIMRDLKRHTSEMLHKAIKENRTESRREWMLWMMERAGKLKGGNIKFQLWQPEITTTHVTQHKAVWYKQNRKSKLKFTNSFKTIREADNLF